MRKYYAGFDTCHLTAETRNKAGDLITPATSILCWVWDSVKALVVTAEACTAESTGVYFYNYTPAATVNKGVYTWVIRASDVGVFSTPEVWGEFEVRVTPSTST